MVNLDITKIAMPVDHFTVVSVLVPDGSGGTTTKYFTQTEYTDLLRNALVKALKDARDTGVDNGVLVDVNATIVAASNAYWNDVAVPLLNESKTSCTFAQANLVTVAAEAHSDEILGIARPEFGPAYAAALQNCWKEETATCMTMSPGRYAGLKALAREMAIEGVLKADGTEPDPLHPTWCGDINGYFTITRDELTDIGGSASIVEHAVTHAVIWLSAHQLRWWNQDGTFTVQGTVSNPTHSVADVTGDYTDNETWPWQDSTCTIDTAAHSVLNQVPVGASLSPRSYSPTTGAATATQGLSVAGYPVPIPGLDGTLTGSNTCSSVLGGPYYFNWWTPVIDQQYPLTVDAAKGDVNAGWDNTVSDGDGYTHTVHYAIDANLHVDGLKDFLAAGHP
jgi:hypothetical protein